MAERPGMNEDGTMPRRFSRALPTLTNLVGSLNDRLLFAVPKKGRLNQACIELLSGSDIQFHRHNRLDIALVWASLVAMSSPSTRLSHPRARLLVFRS
jgi:hypothetical protein